MVRFSRLTGVCALLLFCGALWAPAAATDYTTYHFDNARTGWNSKETLLNVSSVKRLSEIGNYTLDGEVDAQPLYFRGVVYVVTENATLYAFSPEHGLIWSRHFGTPVSDTYAGKCLATAPTIGIQSTPVIDPRMQTLYFAAYTIVRGRPTYTLHEIAAQSGAELRSADFSRQVVNTYVHRQRAALLLANANVYIGLAGFCDHHADTTYGRMLGYSAATLAFKSAFVTTPSPACGGFHMGTIWAEGFGPAADSHGNVYFSTGNGCIDYAHLPNGGYGDAVLRLTPDLRLVSTKTALFAPCNAIVENAHDQEMGSAGVLLVPGTRFAIAGGKTGVTYVLDRSDLGGFHAPCPDRVVYEAETNWGIWGGPVTWKSGSQIYVVIPGTGPHGVRSYRLDAKTGVLALRSQTDEFLHNGGESAIITSDAAGSPASALLWVLTRPTTGTMYLQAYDALNLHRRLISVPAGSWGNPYGYANPSPAVADGYVFVATNKQLTIWTIRESRAIVLIWLTIVALLVLAALLGVAIRFGRRAR